MAIVIRVRDVTGRTPEQSAVRLRPTCRTSSVAGRVDVALFEARSQRHHLARERR